MPPKRRAAILLEKDQLWKVNEGYVQIVEIGKLLIHYRMFKSQTGHGVPLKTTSIKTVQSYLKSNRAVLVKKRK